MESLPTEIIEKIIKTTIIYNKMSLQNIIDLSQVSKLWLDITTREKKKGHKTYVLIHIANIFAREKYDYIKVNSTVTLGVWYKCIRKNNFYYLAVAYNRGSSRMKRFIGNSFYSDAKKLDQDKFLLCCAYGRMEELRTLSVTADKSIKTFAVHNARINGQGKLYKCIRKKLNIEIIEFLVILKTSKEVDINIDSSQINIFIRDKKISFPRL